MNIKKLSEDMVDWVKQYCLDNGIKSLVVGVSGGVDSSVVAALSARTGLKTICVAMPIDEKRDADATRKAEELMKTLNGCLFLKYEIGTIVDAYKKSGIGITDRLEEGNLRARVRANILYALAARNNGVVMGTGNKDEDEIGYATKGGDLLTDLNVMSDAHKSVVWELGKFLGVPEKIINAKPTAGLWDGQTDEEELGMKYKGEIDWAIDWDDKVNKNLSAFPNLEEHNKAVVDIEWNNFQKLLPRQKEVLTKVRSMRKKNAHKLHYPPVFKVELEKYNE